MKEYKIAGGWQLFLCICSPALFVGFACLLFYPVLSGKPFPTAAYLLTVPLSLGMMTLAVVGLHDAIKGKFFIDDEKVGIRSTFINRDLSFDEIEGYRTDKNYLYIEPVPGERKTIKISSYVRGLPEIERWLSERYPNLDRVETEEERKTLLEDHTLGDNAEERQHKLDRAKRTATVLNWTGALAAAAVFIPGIPVEVDIVACMAVPLIAMIVLRRANGLIRIDKHKNSIYPAISIAFFVPSIMLALKAAMAFHIYNYDNLWLPFLSLTTAFVAVAALKNKAFSTTHADTTGSRVDSMVTLLFCAAAYAFGAVLSINCCFDRSQPQVYYTTVTGKRISNGKSKSYYLEFAAWGPQKKTDDVSVSRKTYNDFDEHDNVRIYQFSGLFQIPWYTFRHE